MYGGCYQNQFYKYFLRKYSVDSFQNLFSEYFWVTVTAISGRTCKAWFNFSKNISAEHRIRCEDDECFFCFQKVFL